MSGTVETLYFGTNVHGTPAYSSGGTWYRVDTYTSKSGEVSRERYFAAGREDDSNIWYGERDHERCSCCYLNFGHTTDSHNRHIANHDNAVHIQNARAAGIREQGSALTPVIALITLVTVAAVLLAQSGLIHSLMARLAEVR